MRVRWPRPLFRNQLSTSGSTRRWMDSLRCGRTRRALVQSRLETSASGSAAMARSRLRPVIVSTRAQSERSSRISPNFLLVIFLLILPRCSRRYDSPVVAPKGKNHGNESALNLAYGENSFLAGIAMVRRYFQNSSLPNFLSALEVDAVALEVFLPLVLVPLKSHKEVCHNMCTQSILLRDVQPRFAISSPNKTARVRINPHAGHLISCDKLLNSHSAYHCAVSKPSSTCAPVGCIPVSRANDGTMCRTLPPTMVIATRIFRISSSGIVR